MTILCLVIGFVSGFLFATWVIKGRTKKLTYAEKCLWDKLVKKMGD